MGVEDEVMSWKLDSDIDVDAAEATEAMQKTWINRRCRLLSRLAIAACCR